MLLLCQCHKIEHSSFESVVGSKVKLLVTLASTVYTPPETMSARPDTQAKLNFAISQGNGKPTPPTPKRPPSRKTNVVGALRTLLIIKTAV